MKKATIFLALACIAMGADAQAARRGVDSISDSVDCLTLAKNLSEGYAKNSSDPSERQLAYFSASYSQTKTHVVVDADCVPGYGAGCQGTRYRYEIIASSAESCTLLEVSAY
jgi:hypothetical protein